MPTNFVSYSAHRLTVHLKYTSLSSPKSSLSSLDSSANITSSSSTSHSELDSGHFTGLLFHFKLCMAWSCFFATLLSSALSHVLAFISQSPAFLPSSYLPSLLWLNNILEWKYIGAGPGIHAPPILDTFAFGIASISSRVSSLLQPICTSSHQL